MTSFDGDRLDPALTHADVVIALNAHHMDTAAHALRELLRPPRDVLALRWWIDGLQGADRAQRATQPVRLPRRHGQRGRRRRRARAPSCMDARRRHTHGGAAGPDAPRVLGSRRVCASRRA
jgi:hypothetical protein